MFILQTGYRQSGMLKNYNVEKFLGYHPAEKTRALADILC